MIAALKGSGLAVLIGTLIASTCFLIFLALSVRAGIIETREKVYEMSTQVDELYERYVTNIKKK